MSETGYFESFDRQKLNPTDKDGFKSAMLDFCRSNKMAADALMAGNVEMLGLENLKERFGPSWSKVRGKVHLLTETIIKKIITPHDVYVLANAEQFIVLFGRDDRATANMKAQQIAREVNRRLHGTGSGSGLDGIVVRSLVFEVPREDTDKLTNVKDLTQSVEDARAEKEASETEGFQNAKDSLRLSFWPVTNIRKRLVSMYRAELVVPLGTLPSEGSETGALECAMDVATLQLAKKAFEGKEKTRPLLILPIHMESLISKQYRQLIVDELKSFPHWTERRLILYVTGIDNEVPQAVLHNNFGYVGPLCAGFIGGFNRSFSRAEQLQGASMIGTACTAGDIGEINPGIVEEMSSFVVSNHKGRNRTFTFGAPSLDVATTARKVHYDYVDGPGVAPALGIFGPVFKIG